MNFVEAIQTCLTKYAQFSGRARRSEYWWFFLFNVIVSIVAGVIDAAVMGTGPEDVGVIGLIVSLGLLLPGVAVGVRRLHDTGKSGWWLLIVLVPLAGFIVLIVFMAKRGDAGENQYGADPLDGSALPPASGGDDSGSTIVRG